MQAPFLCLISFLDRCRYLSIGYILTKTVPGEYVQLPLSERMINRGPGKIYQLYSGPLYTPWGQADRRLSPYFAAEMGSQNLLLMCHLSLLSHTKISHHHHPPQAMVLCCSHPNEAFQYTSRLDEMTFVWCKIYCFFLFPDMWQVETCQVWPFLNLQDLLVL